MSRSETNGQPDRAEGEYKMKTKNIVKPDYLKLGDLKKIPNVIKEWLLDGDGDYNFDNLLNDQTISFANRIKDSGPVEVIKIEKCEWAYNYGGRKNEYDSDITVWVTAIVDLGYDRIVRLSFDLLDSLMMTYETGCSGSVHEPR